MLAATLIFADIMTDLAPEKNAERENPTFLTFSLSFGTILFVFGGISAFPTIQNDMREPYLFPRSVFMAYIGNVL